MVRENTYINIQAFMRNELKLKGNELLVYAIIYGFSQDEETKFTGSSTYIADWIGLNKKNVLSTLKKLVDKNLIIKHKKVVNGVTLCDYEANKNVIGSYETSPGVVTKSNQGGYETSPHNIEDTIDTNNSIKEENILKEEKFSCGEFNNVFLTEAQAEKLEHEIYGNIEDLKTAVQILDTYIENNPRGKKYKNHYAVLGKHNWVYKRVQQEKIIAPIKRGGLY